MLEFRLPFYPSEVHGQSLSAIMPSHHMPIHAMDARQAADLKSDLRIRKTVVQSESRAYESQPLYSSSHHTHIETTMPHPNPSISFPSLPSKNVQPAKSIDQNLVMEYKV